MCWATLRSRSAPVVGPSSSKGKTAIVVPGMDQFVPTIETVIAALRAGELDEL